MHYQYLQSNVLESQNLLMTDLKDKYLEIVTMHITSRLRELASLFPFSVAPSNNFRQVLFIVFHCSEREEQGT